MPSLRSRSMACAASSSLNGLNLLINVYITRFVMNIMGW